MLNQAFIKTIAIEDLELLDAETLVSPACLARLEEMAGDAEFDFEPGRAVVFYEKLSSLINQYKEEIKRNPTTYTQIMKLLWQISWKSLSSQGQKARKQMLSEGLAVALKMGVDVKTELKKVLAPFEFGTLPDKQLRQDLAYALEHNNENLGSRSIAVENNPQAKPTVENWLKSYNSAQPLTQERGKFNQINYLNQDKNPRVLMPEDKEILADILEIYDWLLFPPPASQIISASVKEPGETTSEYVKAEKFVMPQELSQKAEPTLPKAEEVKKQPPVVPQRKVEPAEPVEPQPAIEQKKPAPAVAPKQDVDTLQSLMARDAAVRAMRPVNIQDILSKRQRDEEHAGLKIGDGNGNQESGIRNQGKQETLSQPAPLKQGPEKPKVDIDKKLEELRNKSKLKS